MPDDAADLELERAIDGFADDLNALVSAVFGGGAEPFAAEAVGGATTLVVITQEPAAGIALTVDGAVLLRLTALYRCAWDHAHEFLSVRSSEFALFVEGSEEPLFRYDFVAGGDASFHFPLGGYRFRPSLEDVIEIAIREFGADTRPGWESAVRAGRASWRDKQLRAAVRDDPACAAEALRHLGYAVAWAGADLPPQRRDDRVLAL